MNRVLFGIVLLCGSLGSFGIGYTVAHIPIARLRSATALQGFYSLRATPFPSAQQYTPFVERPVTSLVIVGDVLYYAEKNSGKLFSYSIAARVEKPLTQSVVPFFESARWSSFDAAHAIISRKEGTTSITLNSQPTPLHTDMIAFSPTAN